MDETDYIAGYQLAQRDRPLNHRPHPILHQCQRYHLDRRRLELLQLRRKHD